MTPMKKSDASAGEPASALISKRIAELGDWRGKMLARIRTLIKAADPEVVEEWKWGIPVWSHDGIITTGESYKTGVKLTFAKGASLKDPAHLFTSSLEGNVRRAMDIREGEDLKRDRVQDPRAPGSGVQQRQQGQAEKDNREESEKLSDPRLRMAEVEMRSAYSQRDI